MQALQVPGFLPRQIFQWRRKTFFINQIIRKTKPFGLFRGRQIPALLWTALRSGITWRNVSRSMFYSTPSLIVRSFKKEKNMRICKILKSMQVPGRNPGTYNVFRFATNGFVCLQPAEPAIRQAENGLFELSRPCKNYKLSSNRKEGILPEQNNIRAKYVDRALNEGYINPFRTIFGGYWL